jgi:anionic cell wall polymer biosynthesis LytR-Cps2A-Psr (LCP) family protein
MTDFADFSWLVDSIGGVDINVPNTFMDSEYPEDVTKTYQTISFTAGQQKLNGAQALIYARSRHGNNGEGSDWARQKRQHLLLKGILESFFQPTSLFKSMKLEDIFKTLTTAHMETNLEVADLYYLYDLYKDRSKYTIESAFLNDDFVYNPPMSEYGGAWVLAPKDGSYETFHKYLQDKLEGIEVVESSNSMTNSL